MGQLTLTVPDEHDAVILAAFDDIAGRVTTDENGQEVVNYTKVNWVRKQLMEVVKTRVKAYLDKQSVETSSSANAATVAAIDIDFTS